MPTIADLILETLHRGPATGLQITRRLETEHQVPLAGREGIVYAALIELERGGYVTSEMGESSGGKVRRLYRLPVLQDLRSREGRG